jgi:thymidylate synthase (FAD)
LKSLLVSHSILPCRTMALAARTCYSEHSPLEDSLFSFSEEREESFYWDWLVGACLQKGHYSPLEYCQLTFVCCSVPLPVVVQLRTHRLLSLQVQSMRYTGKRMTDFTIDSKDLFYSRENRNSDRQGNKEIFDTETLNSVWDSARLQYAKALEQGIPPEVARDILPCSYVQNFVLSCNLRELFHVFNMRSPKDAQLEIRELMLLLKFEALKVVPAAIDWFDKKYWGKYHGSF